MGVQTFPEVLIYETVLSWFSFRRRVLIPEPLWFDPELLCRDPVFESETTGKYGGLP